MEFGWSRPLRISLFNVVRVNCTIELVSCRILATWQQVSSTPKLFDVCGVRDGEVGLEFDSCRKFLGTKCIPFFYPFAVRGCRFQPGSASTTCIDCPPGSRCGGTVEPEPCPVGYFQNTTGAWTCTICPAGRFNPTINQSECSPCPKHNKCPCVPCVSGNSVNQLFFLAVVRSSVITKSSLVLAGTWGC